jgi:hypothetical protein
MLFTRYVIVVSSCIHCDVYIYARYVPRFDLYACLAARGSRPWAVSAGRPSPGARYRRNGEAARRIEEINLYGEWKCIDYLIYNKICIDGSAARAREMSRPLDCPFRGRFFDQGDGSKRHSVSRWRKMMKNVYQYDSIISVHLAPTDAAAINRRIAHEVGEKLARDEFPMTWYPT